MTPWSLARRTYAAHAAFQDDIWEGHDVWSRDFTPADVAAYEHDAVRALPAVAPPEVFSSELPEAELMSYRELVSSPRNSLQHSRGRSRQRKRAKTL